MVDQTETGVSRATPRSGPAGGADGQTDIASGVQELATMGSRDRSRSPKPLLSVEEAAVLLGQSRSSIYRAIDRGDLPLPVFTINGRLRIPRRAVERAARVAEVTAGPAHLRRPLVSRGGNPCAPPLAGPRPRPHRCSGGPCAPSTSPGEPASATR